MRDDVDPLLSKGRALSGPYASTDEDKLFGYFLLMGPCNQELKIIASMAWEEWEWEHVSVSTPRRCPNWPEMCFVKDLFWKKEETVVQFHPPESKYISNHPYCLHMFRHSKIEFPMPPDIMVGVKE
jgi:hypothetical protein